MLFLSSSGHVVSVLSKQLISFFLLFLLLSAGPPGDSKKQQDPTWSPKRWVEKYPTLHLKNMPSFYWRAQKKTHTTSKTSHLDLLNDYTPWKKNIFAPENWQNRKRNVHLDFLKAALWMLCFCIFWEGALQDSSVHTSTCQIHYWMWNPKTKINKKTRI